MDTRYFVAKSGKWRIEISGKEDDAQISFFGAAPLHVRSDCERFRNSGYRYTAKQLEGEVGKWHHAYDALMVERNQLVNRIKELENKLKKEG